MLPLEYSIIVLRRERDPMNNNMKYEINTKYEITIQSALVLRVNISYVVYELHTIFTSYIIRNE